MTISTPAQAQGGLPQARMPGGAGFGLSNAALFLGFAIGLVAALQLFYTHVYSVHTDLAGAALSGKLSVVLGNSFGDYSLYFPPAERWWFTLATWLSDATGMRLDLTVIAMSSLAVVFSTGLAYHIRRETVGATPAFLALSVGALVLVPILYKNVFGVREHLVVLGLWPYLVLRLSDPEGTIIGWKTRLVVSLWLGATLLMKYLYSLVVLLVEVADAAVQRRPALLFRIENLIAGTCVALYLLFWLVLDPAQREAIAVVVSAIDANLSNTKTNVLQAAIHFALAAFFLLLAVIYKLPARVTAIGLALAAGAIIVAWIQSRWYSHHLFPITVAYLTWWWICRADLKLLWQVALFLVIVRPVPGEFRNSAPYQITVNELDAAMDDAGISVEGKRVGLLTMHPSPFNQHLAARGAWRWLGSMNNSYVAAELHPFDQRENAGKAPPPVTLDQQGRAMLHDEMLRLWEDMPPDALILDHSTSWPLRHIDVRWREVFAEDTRFAAILDGYRPVFEHKGEWLEFTYYERAE